ncbi:aldo/keto reductase [Polyporus arcularius HHB13444]|uniref:Aldo/keto reductase n=1 Tax=Polyporus arcularius HHB13444 TaxID=1314778 RepID=A0A5C3PMQ7_9APHY|nr:aldo/keto reductase [Polyporus arcularius HHB13444]
MVVNTVKLGGTASGITVAKVAHGLMRMGYAPSEEIAFESIKAGVDALPPGVKMFLNSSEFYAPDLGTGNLEMLSRFYEKYPDYAEKTFLSVKGGNRPKSMVFDSSPENLRRSVDTINAALCGTKRVDLYETARVDPNVPVEEAVKTLVQLKNEGKFDHIGMSECRAETLRRANAVHPIAAVEIEVSLWAYEEETKKVIATARELGIPVIAYSPLGKGLSTDTFKTRDELPEGDFRLRLAQFQEENLKANLAITEALKGVAARKGITPAQLSIAWVASLGPHMIPLPGSSKASRTLENLAAGDIELTQAELDEIADIMAKHEVKGERYFGGEANQMLHLWG